MCNKDKVNVGRTEFLLAMVRNGDVRMSFRQQVELAFLLALPAMLSQVSSVVMEYIDASMVGRLGACESASVGLVATTMWLFWGLGGAVATGFSVQVAHKIGGNDGVGARAVLRQSLFVCLSLGLLFSAAGVAISGRLPYWLGAGEDVARGSIHYFLVFALSLPVFMLTYLMSAMLRCSGHVKIQSYVQVGMCVLDVVFNFFLIFPSRTVSVFGCDVFLPGAGLSVMGAALGTALAELTAAVFLFVVLCYRTSVICIFGKKKQEDNVWSMFLPVRQVLKKALAIGLPIACERVVMCGAQICTTVIVAPLGMYAIAANSFGVNAESLCYMPGYGVSDAATTLVGQSVGAGRRFLAKRFACITVAMGMVVMTLMGVLMYTAAPVMMAVMSPVGEIISLGTSALRIEAFAEPMFAASIVCYGAFVGAGDTLVPSVMNLGSIWVVRITLAVLLAPVMGLDGVWMAMCVELCVRGFLFLLRLRSDRWMPKSLTHARKQ